jgi:hypothetical protein
MVTAVKDSNTYPTSLKISDDELAALNLCKDSFMANGITLSSSKPQRRWMDASDRTPVNTEHHGAPLPLRMRRPV